MSASAATWEFLAAGEPLRLDQFLAEQDLGLTRSRLHGLITSGQARLNGSPAKPAQRVRPGDRVSLTVPLPRRLDLLPQSLPLTVVYQDSDLVVIDKPAGLSVHPGPGHPDGTLVNALLARCPDLQAIGDAIRPGIVHRLDKDTSGLMVVAKTEPAHRSLSAQIKARKVTKGYLALVAGVPAESQGRIDAPIARDPRHRKRMSVVLGGRPSCTNYRVQEQLGAYSLLELYLESGRTHQIRVHLAYLGHPLFGDRVYGRASPILSRQFLHAHHLGFAHPKSGEPLDFHCSLPEELTEVVRGLRLERPTSPAA